MEDIQRVQASRRGHKAHLTKLFPALGKSEESFGSLLIPIILSKLPVEVQKNLAREQNNSEWTLNILRQAILKEVTILEAAIPIDNPLKAYGQHTTPSVTASFHTNVSGNTQGPPLNEPPPPTTRPRGPPTCLYCKGKHHPTTCKSVLDPNERYQMVKKENRCFNCLGRHKVSACKSQNRCQNCKRKHHTSICTNTRQEQEKAKTPNQENLPQVTPVNAAMTVPVPNTSTNTEINGTMCLLKTAIAPVRSQHFTVEAHILFDEGAQRSFITQDLVDQLQLKPIKRDTIGLSAFGTKTPTTRQLDVVTVDLVTEYNETVSLDVLVVPQIATPLKNHLPSVVPNLQYLAGLKLAHPVTSDARFEISLLIGVDYYWQLVQDEVVRGDGPVAVKSKLGYLLSGPVRSNPTSKSTTNVLNVIISPEIDKFDVERFWTIESLGIESPEPNGKTADPSREYRSTSLTRTEDGGYIAAFPWKTEHPPLPTNFQVSERRARSLARRLAKSPHLLKTYGDIIADQENRGFIERVDPQENEKDVHYIPHHPVVKNSNTTPVRIVYDCSCKQSPSTPSLNDCLQVGPPLLSDMCSILLRFRTHCFAFSTDIEKAFLHVGLHEHDRNFTRFLWLSNPNDPESPFTTYRFKVVLFGSTSSPFMLNATLQHHLENFNTPVTKDMQRNLYVDNLISGCESEAKALSYYEEARSIMAQGKFNLRSWASNSKQLCSRADDEKTNDQSDEVCILGLQWNPSTDKITLTQNGSHLNQSLPMTKRTVLQQSAKVYDPLGRLIPVTVRARILIQELWRRNLPWDASIPQDLQQQWSSIATDIAKSVSEHATVSRQFFSEPSQPQNNLELHVFADASTVAYGAVAFLRYESHTSFVMAKNRVAPLKTLTLPQLELMAALIGARLANFIQQSLEKRFQNLRVVMWTDSQIVLHWLSSQKPLKQFIHNRVKEINSLYPSTTWHYCPTSDNPADLLTRGVSADQLRSSSIWQHGPPWLTFDNNWPRWSPTEMSTTQALATTLEEPAEETSTQTAQQSGIHNLIDVSKHTRLNHLLRVTAYVFRFISNLRKRNPPQHGTLTAKEIQEAERKWIQNTQSLAYTNEITNLNSKTSKRLALVRQLRLYLDKNGLIRCGGRIHNAPVDELTKFPYLLPPKHPFTNLVIEDIHRNQLHAGVNSTVTALRQKFWIPAARQSVKSVLRRCVNCRKVVGKPYQAPDPAPLPKSRIQELVPFKRTGVDFTGALYVKSNGQEEKVYICLFTCAVTRAVHLEVVNDLTEETFLQAFRRFASRKSLPTKMISDNASTYLSAANELKQLFESPHLKEEFANRGVEWEFIPKRAPWYGGFWERLIGMTKTVIKKVLGRAKIDVTTLQTLVTEVEAVLNDRPLTYVTSDLQDVEPLTPSHLVYGRRITSLPYPMTDNEEINDPDFLDESEAKKRFKNQALKLQHFELRWKREYLTHLREFHKKTGNNEQSVKVGDVVLVHSDKPRMQWKMAVIEKLIRGADGFVRAVQIRTSNGKTNRPITKLYPLEITASTEETTEKPEHEPIEEKKETERPKRIAAQKATRRISNWVNALSAPPEDVEN